MRILWKRTLRRKIFSFDKASSRQLEAEARQLTLWNKAWEWGNRFEDDAWKKNLPARIFKKYTSQPLAKAFRNHEKDAELFELRSKEKRLLRRQ